MTLHSPVEGIPEGCDLRKPLQTLVRTRFVFNVHQFLSRAIAPTVQQHRCLRQRKGGFDRLPTIEFPFHCLVATEDGFPIATEVTP